MAAVVIIVIVAAGSVVVSIVSAVDQVIQSPTLVKLVHLTCTFACKCGTSWCRPMHAKLVWAGIGTSAT